MTHSFLRYIVIVSIVVTTLAVTPSFADNGYPYPGTKVFETKKSFSKLWKDLEKAISDNKMGLVGRASASFGAKHRGIKIKGNAVFGIYRNDFAVRMLKASVPAGIEAPLRVYITETYNGNATLTYRLPSAVFKPYGNDDLDVMAKELDQVFAAIVAQAIK